MDGAAGTTPNVNPGPMISGSFVSRARLGKTCGWAVSYPPGTTPGQKLPVLLVLHGYSDNHTNAFGNRQGLDRFLAQAVDKGSAPFAVAAVDGGDTYWHRRATGEDSGAMLTEEFIPLLAKHGLDTERIGLMGWSMGGYGALLIAEQLGQKRVAAVAAESPALWHRADQAAHIAFDGPADFAAHTLFGRQKQLAGIPIRIDCGTGDGFCSTVRDYAASLMPRPAGGFTAGGHNEDFWRRVAPEQLAFIATHLG